MTTRATVNTGGWGEGDDTNPDFSEGEKVGRRG
jgi:hypothetical protein